MIAILGIILQATKGVTVVFKLSMAYSKYLSKVFLYPTRLPIAPKGSSGVLSGTNQEFKEDTSQNG